MPYITLWSNYRADGDWKYLLQIKTSEMETSVQNIENISDIIINVVVILCGKEYRIFSVVKNIYHV